MTATLPTTDSIGGLAAELPGLVTRPGDARWDEAHLPWARTIAQQPIAVVEATEPEHVVTALRYAAEHGLTVSAQPVGHGATTALDGTVLLRTRGLRSIEIDAQRRVARVGAGVKWGELLAATAPYGFTGLAGSSPDPSVVGFTVGGGLSWFSRAHGLAAHSVRSFQIVDAQGGLREITAESDAELFWAMCGGGGDFAIVTSVEIDLFPAPHVYGGQLMWPIEMAAPVLRAFRDIAATAPDELTVWAHLRRFPPAPMVPEPLRGKSFVSVETTYLGAGEEAEAMLAPLRAIPSMVNDTMGTVELAALGAICAEPIDPMPTKETSALLDDLDDATIDRLLDVAGPGAPSPLVVVQLRSLGGALTRSTSEHGPAGAVHEPFQVFALGVVMSPELGLAIDGAFAALHDALRPQASVRTFFTFMSNADPDVTRAFTPEALDRLRLIKAAADPNGTIRSNRPIR